MTNNDKAMRDADLEGRIMEWQESIEIEPSGNAKQTLEAANIIHELSRQLFNVRRELAAKQGDVGVES